MIVPDEVAFKLLDWVPIACVAVGGFGWRLINKRIDTVDSGMRTHMEEVHKVIDKRITDVVVESDRQREVAAKIFDKLESMSKESADRHISLLQALHTGLNGKADK